LDGNKITRSGTDFVYIMLNKPAGYTCSASDPHAEHLAIELIDVPQRIFYAGRLDRDSEGLLIFSNDGNYVQELAHPRYGVTKLYRVTVNKSLSRDDMEKMCSGITDDDGDIRALKVDPVEKNTYTFLLNEGKKREIRRLVKAVGKRVVRLIRVRQGNLELGNLGAGKWRYLTPEEAEMAKGTPEK
ncbi:MAG: rRNA pseudouridine synthase, partial [Lentisphaeria bacterium]|nr:rRNA pseudouridine synthase [Lentisphaeria bacterium]